jgi:hypothetical protein
VKATTVKATVASTTVETTATTMETTATAAVEATATAAMEATATMTAALRKKRFCGQTERERHCDRAENFQKGMFTHGSNSGRAPRCLKRINFIPNLKGGYQTPPEAGHGW